MLNIFMQKLEPYLDKQSLQNVKADLLLIDGDWTDWVEYALDLAPGAERELVLSLMLSASITDVANEHRAALSMLSDAATCAAWYKHQYKDDSSARDGETEFLAEYQKSEYAAKPDTFVHTVDNVIFTPTEAGKLGVLLVRRGNHPYKGYWALPGGFVDAGEPYSAAAARELQEETNVSFNDVIIQERVGEFSHSLRDPRNPNAVSHAYAVYTTKIDSMAAGDDAVECAVFDVAKTMVASDIAFDHKRIIAAAVERVLDMEGM